MTILKGLCDYLGLNPGSDIEFELREDGRVFLKTGRQPVDRFARWRGSLKTSMTADEIMVLLRGEDDK